MGSQMPEHADELAVAGGLRGRPLPVVKALTQDLLVPAESEIVLEGVLQSTRRCSKGRSANSSAIWRRPITRRSSRSPRSPTATKPIYHAINGYGRETVMLRKYVLEASLLKVLQSAMPIVTDVEMTAGGLHRFHAVVQVKKTGADRTTACSATPSWRRSARSRTSTW